MEGLSQVLAVADELYGLLPETFTATRDERVRELRRDGARARAVAVKDLRRPSVAAWLVNALVRHRTAHVEQLLQVGQALREAHNGLDVEQLRELNRQRQAVLVAMVQQAQDLAAELGRPVTRPVLDEVEETLRAGLADPAAAAAIRAGRLTGALRYAGFGGDDDDQGELGQRRALAPAARTPARSPTAAPGSQPGATSAAHAEALLSLRAAQDAARRAEGNALAALEHRDGVLRRTEVARQRLEAAHARVAELESLLAAARAATSTAAAAWAPLHAEAEAAATRAQAAQGLADSARMLAWSAQHHLEELQRAAKEDAAQTAPAPR